MDNEIPKILISATIYDSDDEDNIPSIIVTRDSREEDFSSSSPRTPPSLYPASMHTAAADTEAVEDFIQSRLELLGLVDRRKVEPGAVLSLLEDVLECPVCRDMVRGEVYQCHQGHVMCSHCRSVSPHVLQTVKCLLKVPTDDLPGV